MFQTSARVNFMNGHIDVNNTKAVFTEDGTPLLSVAYFEQYQPDQQKLVSVVDLSAGQARDLAEALLRMAADLEQTKN